MRILIAGTGGVGGYFGALLARAGRDVVFLARGRNLAALRERGLTVESVDGDMRLPHVTATDTLADAAPVDLVLVTVKSYDTSATAAVIAPVVTRETIVLSLQNGIENEGVLAAALGLPPLLGAMTQIGAELTAPGVVRHVAQGILLDPARVDPVIAYAAEHLGTLRTSMLQDVERGRRLEYDAINGAVVRAGDAIGVPTPLNRALVALLAALDPQRPTGERGAGRVTPIRG